MAGSEGARWRWKSHSALKTIAFCLCLTSAGATLKAAPDDLSVGPSASGSLTSRHVRNDFGYREVMIPMRDGVRLETAILTPIGEHSSLPILLIRTPYRVPEGPPGELPPDLNSLADDGYVFVFQNIRGRYGSEGNFDLSTDTVVDHTGETIETRDAWDTIDWLVKNVADNNGMVGLYGYSYSAYTASAALLHPHPALKAVSEQAAPVDQWMNDDFHHYGALRFSYLFEYLASSPERGTPLHFFPFDRWDTFTWYDEIGSPRNLTHQLPDNLKYWHQVLAHPNYDRFWRRQNWLKFLRYNEIPVLNVAGFWDQEDPWGPWEIFRQLSNGRRTEDLMVAGPWCHACWRRSGATLGPIPLGQDTGQYFREKIEAPFFAYWLHGKGIRPNWQAQIFQTGTNSWLKYDRWPPANTQTQKLYLHSDGTLSFRAPARHERPRYRSYVSDPTKPVPYRSRPISPIYPGGDWRNWESSDQRFVDGRPDVLTFESAPLERDVVVTGPVAAVLFASTSGTDTDFVIKLIDVFPENAQPPTWPQESGPPPGTYGQTLNGYELPIAMEVRRGRYLSNPAHPHALTPGKAVRWSIPLRDRDHVFARGHRIMVQIQSTWFPLIDRNEPEFGRGIKNRPSFRRAKTTERIFVSYELPSHVSFSVVN